MDLDSTVRPVVEGAGLELVEVELNRDHGRQVLRITVDREGGVDLDTIAGVSDLVSRRLDETAYVAGPYALEVSSPGVERPLRGPRDFGRRVGERVKVKTTRPVDGTRTLKGTILAASPREVRLATDAGERSLSYDDITSARIVFEWGGGR